MRIPPSTTSADRREGHLHCSTASATMAHAVPWRRALRNGGPVVPSRTPSWRMPGGGGPARRGALVWCTSAGFAAARARRQGAPRMQIVECEATQALRAEAAACFCRSAARCPVRGAPSVPGLCFAYSASI